jgi:betaine-aldehyde dehydrogenase
MLVGGQLTQGCGGQREILDPARGSTLTRVADATARDVGQAVSAARATFSARTWPNLPPIARGEILQKVAERIRANAGELALTDSLNAGKPIRQARDDAQQAADFFDYFGRVIADLPDEIVQNDDAQLSLVVREPLGVVAAIVPWNFPIVLAAAAVAPALAAGNTVVLKPSELTPLSALRLGELVADVLPPGTLSIVAGAGDPVGRHLAAHPDVSRISFTGSTRTGAALMRLAADRMTRIGLELGGKSPTIVFDDAPFDQAVTNALQRLVLNQGENCAAGSRLLVSESIYDQFLTALAEAAERLVIGDPQQEATDLGPMISSAHRDKVSSYIELGRSEGAVLYEGDLPRDPELSGGFFMPVAFYEVPPASRLWREEVFGPVLAVTSFKDDDEAVALANDSDYGLMAVIWTADRARGIRVARRLESGIVRINNSGSPLHAPWGGLKQSGIGRGYGRYAIHELTELKQINVDIT